MKRALFACGRHQRKVNKYRQGSRGRGLPCKRAQEPQIIKNSCINNLLCGLVEGKELDKNNKKERNICDKNTVFFSCSSVGIAHGTPPKLRRRGTHLHLEAIYSGKYVLIPSWVVENQTIFFRTEFLSLGSYRLCTPITTYVFCSFASHSTGRAPYYQASMP